MTANLFTFLSSSSFIFPCFCVFAFLLSHLGSPRPASSLPLLSAGNSILHSAADSVTSAVQKASQALNERGERLGRAEERTADMMNSAEQFAVTAHKVSPYASKTHKNASAKGGKSELPLDVAELRAVN